MRDSLYQADFWPGKGIPMYQPEPDTFGSGLNGHHNRQEYSRYTPSQDFRDSAQTGKVACNLILGCQGVSHSEPREEMLSTLTSREVANAERPFPSV
jgi:hypothetical protein